MEVAQLGAALTLPASGRVYAVLAAPGAPGLVGLHFGGERARAVVLAHLEAAGANGNHSGGRQDYASFEERDRIWAHPHTHTRACGTCWGCALAFLMSACGVIRNDIHAHQANAHELLCTPTPTRRRECVSRRRVAWPEYTPRVRAPSSFPVYAPMSPPLQS